uniref:Large ribosomal subunit protein bL36m n=2 Tax=Plectus sambesii TaxID=2011161 RepID=A0A914W0D8_9BILA
MAAPIAASCTGLLRAALPRALSARFFGALGFSRQPTLLTTNVTPLVQQVAGFKVRQLPKRRCHYCYFVRVNGRLHVECSKHGRHKQREPFNAKLLW